MDGGIRHRISPPPAHTRYWGHSSNPNHSTLRLFNLGNVSRAKLELSKLSLTWKLCFRTWKKKRDSKIKYNPIVLIKIEAGVMFSLAQMMFNRVVLPSYLRAAIPHHYLPGPVNKTYLVTRFIHHLARWRAARLPPPPAHILNLPRLLQFSSLLAPLPWPSLSSVQDTSHPAIARLSPMMNIEQNSALSPEWWTNGRLLPIFGRSCPISLSPVFEPIADLCGCQPCGLGQLSLLAGIRIGIWNRPKVKFQRRSHLRGII